MLPLYSMKRDHRAAEHLENGEHQEMISYMECNKAWDTTGQRFFDITDQQFPAQ